MHSDPEVIKRLSSGKLNGAKTKKAEPSTRKRSRLPEEPELIQRDDSLLSEESKRLAEQPTHGPFGGGMASELSELHQLKGSKQ